jgi:hypothetical protein
MTPSRAVYTVLLGGYERLNDQPLAAASELPFICFTDDDTLLSETWEIRVITPSFPLDLVRSQRDVKIRGHASLAVFDETLYIDNSVTLKVLPEHLLDDWLAIADLAICQHSYRDRVVDEFDEVIALNYDEPSRVNEQLLHYAELYPDILQQRPFWNALIARRHSTGVELAMATWYEHVLRFSRRDQLSANVAVSISGLPVNPIHADNWESEFHSWPAEVGRKTHLGLRTQRRTGPLLAEVARLERSLAIAVTLRNDEHEALMQAESRAEKIQVRLATSEKSREILLEDRDSLKNQIRELHASASWRITRFARFISRAVRSRRTHN